MIGFLVVGAFLIIVAISTVVFIIYVERKEKRINSPK